MDLGYTKDLKEKEAFRISVSGEKFYLIAWNITQTRLDIRIPNADDIILEADESAVIDLDGDSEDDVVLKLNSIEGDTANLHIENFKIEIPESDHKELFDVEVGLSKDILTSAKDLIVFIKFTNFGEGPSHISIAYSIFSEDGKEFYTGIDNKVAYTEDSLVKNFDFLNLPIGKYKVISEISYGNNQTAASESSFEIIKKSADYATVRPIIYVISIIVFVLFVQVLRKKFGKRYEGIKTKEKK